ncbi:MAG TPA: hypothetical protein VFL03_11165, partial [Candidatus Limnocylindrales bacterium]|nr:hypothetical protein [Candidatus Limnocylindrales bacterium]
MTDITGTERLLAAWLEGEAPPRAPDGLRDDILTATSRIRPRPAWLARLKGNHMDVIVGGRTGRSSYRRSVPILVALVLLVAMLVGAAIVGSRLLYESTPMPAVSRVPFADPVAQVIQGEDGTTWASTALNDAGSFRVTGIHRVNPDGVTSTPVVTDLPPGHTSFVVLDGVIWASTGESETWHSYDAETGAALGSGPIGAWPLEPRIAFG